MTQQTTALITAVANVAVPVSDHDRAITFYVDTLGLEKRLDASFGPGLRWVEVAPASAATTIALAPARNGTGVDTGIRVTTPDAAATHAELRARDVDVDAEVMVLPGVPPMFAFRDPDGNTLYIIERA